jgi:hypothetical protein
LTTVEVAPDEDKEPLAGRDHVTSLKTWVIHGPLVCNLGILLCGVQRIRRVGAGIRDEFLRPAAGLLHTLLPLFNREL